MKRTLGVGVGGLAVVAGLALFLYQRQISVSDSPYPWPPIGGGAPSPRVAAAPPPPAALVLPPAPLALPAAPVAAKPEPLPEPAGPRFDVVRVTPQGEAVVAGRAAPEAVVTLLDGGKPIAEVKADRRGEWVAVPAAPLEPGSRELSLTEQSGAGAVVASERVVVVAVPDPLPSPVHSPAPSAAAPSAAAPSAAAPSAAVPSAAAPSAAAPSAAAPSAAAPSAAAPSAAAPSAAAPSAAAPSAAAPSAAAPSAASETVVVPVAAPAPPLPLPAAVPPPAMSSVALVSTAPAPVVPAPVAPVVVSMPREGAAPSVVLQPPAAADMQPLPKGGVAVDSLDYDRGGQVALGGRAVPGAAVQLYLDNILVGRAHTDPNGHWRLSPDRPIEPGVYTLRADQVSEAGKVTARVELPVQVSEVPPGMMDGALKDGRSVVVQPGNSLWRLARRTYGDGLRYTQIYRANQEQIRDPDLIYPGQIFSVPSVN